MNAVKKESGKVYIEGARKVSWDTGEMCEFASALVSAMGCLDENVPYPYVMGTCGAAFRFTLNPGEWDYGNYSIQIISADPYGPIRRAMDAVGYAYSLCEKGSRQEDTAKITASIDRGVPVLAFGMVGPSDCCIITGYDEGGEVLLGWSTYQDIPQDHNIPPDVTGYFRKPGWHEDLRGYLLIGAKVGRPPLPAVYRDALQWAVELIRTPRMGQKLTGLEALSAWAEEMVQEKYFPQGVNPLPDQFYLSTAINMTMLRDHCLAEPFLLQAAEDVPAYKPEMSLAAGCYSEVQRIRGGMDDIIGDNFSEKAIQAIANPDSRRAYAEDILRIRAAEEEAVSHIERLLERWD